MYYNSERICTTIVRGKEETIVDKALLTIKEHRPHKNQGINAVVSEG
jgi:hypothetical protein